MNDSTGPNVMSRKHTGLIYAALLASIIRLILRSVFVIVTESPLGIPLISTSLIAIGILLILLRKGGCSMVILYFCVEPLLSTIWWCMLLYALDTNSICSKLGSDVCEDVSGKQLPYDYTRRMHPWWIVLIIPGLIFDCIFLWVFRRPTVTERDHAEIQVMLATVKAERGGPSVGGVGLRQGPREQEDIGMANLGKLDPEDKQTVGLNRPNSAGSVNSNHSANSAGSKGRNSHRARAGRPIN